MMISSFLTGANDLAIQVAGVGCKQVNDYDPKQLAMSFVFGGLFGGIPYAKGLGLTVLQKLEGTAAGKLLCCLIDDLGQALSKALGPLRELKDNVFSGDGMNRLRVAFGEVKECFSITRKIFSFNKIVKKIAAVDCQLVIANCQLDYEFYSSNNRKAQCRQEYIL